MKTFQRILAVILALVMSLSVIGVTAFATTVETTATIDTTKTGSITIHKYEYNGSEVIKGTGSDQDNVPTGANALAGAGFTIYKVADVDALTAYYSTNPTALPKVDAYVENGAIKSNVALWTSAEKTTPDTGVVEFTNLDLGLYVVVETTTPAAVTSPCDPFILSVPMTTVDGENWLYDVHVYPKNGTKYGEVKLEKSGVDGKLSGVTFALQKQNDKTWTDITKESNAQGDNKGNDLNLTTNDSGLITVSNLSQGTYRFIETSVGNNTGYIMDGATAYVFTVNADGTITYGTNDAAASVTIPVLNEKPDMDKQIQVGEGQEAANFSVGDDVPYVITVEVPSNINKLTTFTLTDTLTNQEYNYDLAIAGLTKGEHYTIEESASGYTVTFVPAKLTGGQTLTITYTAELLNTAVTTVAGNPNSAALTYDNEIIPNTDDGNPNEPEDPNTPKTPDTTTITDETVVYTFKLTINKTGENDAKLSGVKFDLYKEVAAGTENAITGDAAKAVGLDSTKSWLKIASDLTTVDGTVSHSGLANGTYYLVETKTNDGYNLLKAPAVVTLNISHKTTWTATDKYNSDGNLVKHEVSKTEEDFGKVTDTTGAGYVETTIINKKGFELPTTGGIGTLMFILMGGVLIAGGICLIAVPNKKRSV